jgi:hypothetical protein
MVNLIMPFIIGLVSAGAVLLGGQQLTDDQSSDLAVGGGLGTIEQLSQWQNDGTYITQNVADTEIKLTGLESSGECLVTDASGVVSVTSCSGAGGGDNVSVDSVGVVDPDFVSTGDIDFTNTANTITADINAGSIIETDLDGDVAPVDGDYLQYDSTGTNFTWRDASEVKTDLSLNLVENTALSTWNGTTNITTLGTISAGTWQGTAIADTYVSDTLTIGAGSSVADAALSANVSLLGTGIDPTELAAADFGDFTCNGTTCSLDTSYLTGANDSITPDMLLSTGQTDEYVLTYELTGDTWEWAEMTAFGGFTDLDTDYGNETITSTFQFQDNGATGAMNAWDVTIGDGVHGGLRIGDAGIYNSSYTSGNIDLGQSLIFRQEGNLDVTNDPGIEFAFLESISNTIRLAIPESGTGNATAFIRSGTFAGPYSSSIGNDIVTCDQWTTYDANIDCDTSGTGADIFVQDDIELEGDIFSSGSIYGDADDANQHQIAFTSATADRLFTFPDDQIADNDFLVGNGVGTFGYEDPATARTSMGLGSIALLSTVDISANTNLAAGRSLTLSGDSIEADAELYTDSFGIWFENPTDADDFKSIFENDYGKDLTITEISCESDQTVNLDLQVDDGTPADVNGTDLVCNSTGVDDTSFAGDSTISDNETVDLAITSVSGTPTWLSITVTFTIAD